MPNQEPTDEELAAALRRSGRADLRAMLRQKEAELPPLPQAKVAKLRRFRPLSIAAVLLPLIAVAAWWLLRAPDYAGMAEQYAFAYPNVVTEPIVRAAGEAPAAGLAAALQAYEREQFAEAQSLLTALPATDTTTFYRAVIAARTGDWEAAEPLMQQLPESSSFKLPAQYYLGLAALQLGETSVARSYFSPLEKWDDYPGIQRRVREILKKLN